MSKLVVPSALALGVALAGCIAPPAKCADGESSGSESSSSSSSSSGGGNASVDAKIKELGLVPVVPNAPIVWNGQNEETGGNNIALINLDPAGSWFVFNDGSPSGEMSPTSTGDFTTAVKDGAVRTKGKGFSVWGGGIGMNFVGSPMLTPVDASGFKGIRFKVSGEGWVHVGLATVITLPEFNICQGTGCYDHYMTDIKLTKEPKVIELKWSDLRQIGFGTVKAKLDPKTVVGLNFTSKGAVPWDFTLDDVGFIE
jgi:hypothetical protein